MSTTERPARTIKLTALESADLGRHVAPMLDRVRDLGMAALRDELKAKDLDALLRPVVESTETFLTDAATKMRGA